MRYAYDTALLSTTPEGLNNLVQAVNKHSAAYKLSINAAKTKIMELDKWQENTNIVIYIINVERVQSFQYLGAMFTTNGDGASNGVARIFVWGGAPGRCHPVHFPGSPEVDPIQWGGGSSRNFPVDPGKQQSDYLNSGTFTNSLGGGLASPWLRHWVLPT